MINRNPPGAKLATRIAFLVSGFGVACWAPLVPLAKARLRIDDGTLGLLLLCLGLGSVGAMQLVGPLVSRVGAKPVIVATGIGLALCLPLLAIAPTAPLLAGALILFGACLGSIDVAMNVHAVEVERCEARPLMSGFHGLFSIGGFAGSSLVTLALSAALGPLFGVVVASAMMLGAMAIAAPRLIATPRSEDTPLLVVPRGVVALLAILAGITFLTEGAILDWGALLLTSRGLVGPEQAGIGYSFAIAMTIGRLTGDAVVARLGDRHTMLWGGVLAIVGYAVLLLAPIITVALLGLLLIGLGASNTVPVLFRRAGAQGAMPAGLAVASVTTIGYAGVLAGPAAIGFVAQHTGLPTAFWVLAALLCLVPLAASAATREQAA